MNPPRIDADDDRVWSRTLAAVKASHQVLPALTVRCAVCRQVLAYVGDVPEFGPLFTAAWNVARTSTWTVNGERLTERQSRQREKADPHIDVTESGHQPVDDLCSTLALLDLPADLPADFPALLVRCARHGDTVLDRTEVLAALKHGETELAAAVAFPLTEFAAPRTDLAAADAAADAERSSRNVTIRTASQH